MPLPLSPSVFDLLRALIEEKTGIHYAEGDRELARKLSLRAEEAGFGSVLAYYYSLRDDERGGDELDALTEDLVVKETYLFREIEPLRAAVARVIAPRVRAGERVRIWSAACATGDEPMSLAVILAEHGLLEGVEIVASDISRRALETARSGLLARQSLRALRPGMNGAPWVAVLPDGTGRVRPDILARIRWMRINLVDGAAVRALGTFQLVLCRNVLIYFTDERTRSVLETLTSALAPGGVLLVSVTESLLRFGTALVCEEHDGTFLYRRAVAG